MANMNSAPASIGLSEPDRTEARLTYRRQERKRLWSFIGVWIVLIGVILYSAMMGSLHVSVTQLLQGLWTGTDAQVNVVRDLRLPRIIIAVMAGAGLAVAGVLFQAVMKNPLADSGVIGISSGAALISLIAVTVFPALYFWMPVFSFFGGALACLMVYGFSWRSGLHPVRLILIGVAVNAIFSGLGQSFNYRGSYAVTSINQVTTSTLSMKKWVDVDVMLWYGGIGLILALLVANWCNYLSLQEKTARNLGLNVTLARVLISVVAVILASTATAIAGVIVFIGLLIPHIGRQLVGSDHKWLIPFSAFAGGLLLLLADTLGRTVLAPQEIPASIIMAILGGPFLIFLIRRSDRVHGR
ncbi:FecCD family ABC transporter permease [Paenibacillus wenxiniae]|uniref:Probable heme-iron transport system permease protein IsdF n=1 Tax=Paenibacillus wenxiniae TaxID=1636843 RepID=A0ABW4RDS5_9BACL